MPTITPTPATPVLSKAPASKDLVELANKCWETTYARMNTRISQLWKARFSVWALLLGSGLLFQKDTPQFGETAKMLIWLMTAMVVITIVWMHIGFELWQERRIRHEREIIYTYADLTHHLLREMVLRTPADDPAMQRTLGRLNSIESHYVQDEPVRGPQILPDQEVRDAGVAGLRLWVISIVLGIAFVVAVGVRLYGA